MNTRDSQSHGVMVDQTAGFVNWTGCHAWATNSFQEICWSLNHYLLETKKIKAKNKLRNCQRKYKCYLLVIKYPYSRLIIHLLIVKILFNSLPLTSRGRISGKCVRSCGFGGVGGLRRSISCGETTFDQTWGVRQGGWGRSIQPPHWLPARSCFSGAGPGRFFAIRCQTIRYLP